MQSRSSGGSCTPVFFAADLAVTAFCAGAFFLAAGATAFFTAGVLVLFSFAAAVAAFFTAAFLGVAAAAALVIRGLTPHSLPVRVRNIIFCAKYNHEILQSRIPDRPCPDRPWAGLHSRAQRHRAWRWRAVGPVAGDPCRDHRRGV